MWKKSKIWFVLTVLAGLALLHPAAIVAQGPQNYIVTFRPNALPITRATAVRNARAATRLDYTIINGSAISATDAAIAALRNDPAVLAIVPDRPVFAHQHTAGKPGTPGNGNKKGGGGSTDGSGTTSSQPVPAGVARVVPDDSLPYTGQGVGVAVLDTGIDFGHADLGPNLSANAFSAFGSSAQDDNGHGTHVAGTVAAVDNEIDVVGVAPGATLYAVKVLDASGTGSDSNLIAGLEWARDRSDIIQVVNMSLGRQLYPGDIGGPLHQAIQSAVAAGITVVVSAGNDRSTEVSAQVPAAFPEVISVASTTALAGSNKCRSYNGVIEADTASYFTTDGAGVTISAPGEEAENITRGCQISGVGILSTRLGGGTTRKSGTSMAAPHVSGLVARLIEACGVELCSPESIRTSLISLAAGTDTVPYDSPVVGYTYDGVREGIAQAP